jgi:hypothetical protein
MLNMRLKMSLNPPSFVFTSYDPDLHWLADECIHVADERIALLDGLTVSTNLTRLGSFKEAVKTVWNKKKVRANVTELKAITEQRCRVVVDIKSKMDL